MIFQLSDWFPKPMIWAIIVKFDQIRKNWWRISCAEILEVGKKFFAVSSVKKMSRFEEVSPEDIKRIAWKFTKTIILLGLAGYELIITNSAYGLVGYTVEPPVSGHPRDRGLVSVYGRCPPTGGWEKSCNRGHIMHQNKHFKTNDHLSLYYPSKGCWKHEIHLVTF